MKRSKQVRLVTSHLLFCKRSNYLYVIPKKLVKNIAELFLLKNKT